MSERKEREMFLAILVREFPDRAPGAIMELARQLQREARAMQTWAARVCSEPMSAEEEARGERRDAAREQRVTALCAAWGIVPVFQGDPRGAMIKLQLKSGVTDDWGGVGVCVPEGN